MIIKDIRCFLLANTTLDIIFVAMHSLNCIVFFFIGKTYRQRWGNNDIIFLSPLSEIVFL